MNVTEIDLFGSPVPSKSTRPRKRETVRRRARNPDPEMSHAFPSSCPPWLMDPRSILERRFAAFHKANPHVYDALERRALRDLARGAKRLGIAKLAEQLRADSTVTTTGDAFKVNNSFRAFYARLLIHRHPTLDGIMEVRTRVEKGRTVA